MYKLIGKLFFRILPFIYMMVIWLQSSHFNPESIHSLAHYLDMKIILLMGMGLELGHLFEFGFLYVLIIIAFLTFGKLNHRLEFIALVVSIMYGLIDEIHQAYVPFRSASYSDLAKDIIGVIVFWFILHKNYFKDNYSKIGSLLRLVTNVFYKQVKPGSCNRL